MIEEDKSINDSEKFKSEIDKKMKIIDNLKNKLEIFENERITLLEDQSKLAKLYDMG